jgi:prepilin-type N-terminal cleavage/methylation domain-containing protein
VDRTYKKYTNDHMKKQRGFTLIELLVVIAVIGVLAAVVMSSISSARGKGRDAKRLSDTKEIQTALELYYHDNNAYPNTALAWRGTCVGGGGIYGTTGASGYIPNLAPTYIPVLPTEPQPVDSDSCYLYKSNGTDYLFMVYRSVEGSVPNIFKRPSALNEKDFAIYTPGGSGW